MGLQATQTEDTKINCPDLFLQQRSSAPHPSLFLLGEQTRARRVSLGFVRTGLFECECVLCACLCVCVCMHIRACMSVCGECVCTYAGEQGEGRGDLDHTQHA